MEIVFIEVEGRLVNVADITDVHNNGADRGCTIYTRSASSSIKLELEYYKFKLMLSSILGVRIV